MAGNGERTPDSSNEQAAQPEITSAGAVHQTLVVPLLPLVENVVFPKAVYPLVLQGEQAESLLEAAESSNRLVALFLHQEGAGAEPSASDLHRVGTLSRLSEIKREPDGLIEVTAEGIAPVQLLSIKQWTPHVTAEVEAIEPLDEQDPALESLAARTLEAYRGLVSADPTAAARLQPVIEETRDPLDVAYLVAATIPISPAARQAILEARSPSAMLLQLLTFLNKAQEISASSHANGEAPRNVVSLPARAASLDQAVLDRIDLEKQLRDAGMPPTAWRVAQRELDRFSLLTPSSPDYNLVRTYLQWLADLPWQNGSEPDIDLDRARAILDRDHYGLEEVKLRIIEHLAVRKLRRQRASDNQAGCDVETLPDAASAPGQAPTQPVLCLVGPPGVGKTSLGRSISEALNRPFVRISLGGVSDEAEIRGHRRTYLGAMPGRIVQSVARVESSQPVMMLDELDKMGGSGKGDPTAALLDVLDPEQQTEFVDHYIEVPFDVSCVFFLATANTLESVPEALRDRLEVIRLSGYTEEEKAQIATRHLVPRQMLWHALNDGDMRWEPDAVLQIIRSYTREAGVRQLEREIATVCRRVATFVAQDGDDTSRFPFVIDTAFVTDVLGTPRFLPAEPEATDQPGVVTGVFWTPVGGDIMHIEALMMPGSKTLTITGQLGEVMRESAQTALSYVRARAEDLRIAPDFYERHDLHLHIPSGAVAKDGPSAGIALAVAIVSLLTDTPVSGDVAMTGEITLRGRVLPVGGIKEKVLAARRAGVHKVVLPAQNRRDLDDVQPEILQDLKLIFVDTMDEVLEAAFPIWAKGLPASNKAPRKEQANPRATMLDVPSAARAMHQQ
jgi:ATP-dependent Lon protease